jgi:hypothetical protein
MRNTHKNLVIKPEGKKSLGKSSCGWGQDIKRDLEELGGRIWTGFIWLMTESKCGPFWSP